jgi:hypothetical protein
MKEKLDTPIVKVSQDFRIHNVCGCGSLVVRRKKHLYPVSRGTSGQCNIELTMREDRCTQIKANVEIVLVSC